VQKKKKSGIRVRVGKEGGDVEGKKSSQTAGLIRGKKIVSAQLGKEVGGTRGGKTRVPKIRAKKRKSRRREGENIVLHVSGSWGGAKVGKTLVW